MAIIPFPNNPQNLQITVLLCFITILILHAFDAEAQVPANQTFKILNTGHLGDTDIVPFITEYGATYRLIANQFHDFDTFPFRLCFYNTTPAAFVLGIRAGTTSDFMRWVWDANRNRPVGENAALSFGRNGNLVLSDSDGTPVWETGTGNKGVTGIKLMGNGNLVLHDKMGKFIWQSFEHPVDTLLVGSLVRSNSGSDRLISRTSDVDGSNGKYSLVLDESGLLLYLNNSGQRLIYNGWPGNFGNAVRFNVSPTGWEHPPVSWDLHFEILSEPSTTPIGFQNLRSISYNTTYSFIRLEPDGNVRAYTYYDKLGIERWSETFAFFSDYYTRECSLPEKCGAFGLCDNGMCVACPSPKGLMGWNRNCRPPAMKRCRSDEFRPAKYYKVARAESFLNRVWNVESPEEGPMNIVSCRNKCSVDCNCKGFIYTDDTSMCTVLPVLGTIVKFANTSSAYIKY